MPDAFDDCNGVAGTRSWMNLSHPIQSVGTPFWHWPHQKRRWMLRVPVFSTFTFLTMTGSAVVDVIDLKSNIQFIMGNKAFFYFNHASSFINARQLVKQKIIRLQLFR